MAQLQQTAQASVGPIPVHLALTWQEFVFHVLELTLKAYQTMRQDGVAKREWEENTFTLNLGSYIRTLAFDLDSPVRVIVRMKTHTSAMAAGKQATIEATEIDMFMFDAWGERDYDRKGFVWEAKRVGDRRLLKKYSKLSSEYVHEAIYRFIRKNYADGLSDAGILAYVLDGNPEDIVADINRTMGVVRKNPPLPVSCHIRNAPAIVGFKDIFVSDHVRTDNSSIKLHHAFLTFSF